jgi:hypothetical protein
MNAFNFANDLHLFLLSRWQLAIKPLVKRSTSDLQDTALHGDGPGLLLFFDELEP